MSRKLTSFYFFAFLGSGFALFYLWYSLGSNSINQLQSILNNKEIRISMLNTPDNYYIDSDKPFGLEYELVQALAKELKVTAKITLRDDMQGLYTDITDRDSHISIAGYSAILNNPPNTSKSTSYLSNRSVVVYRVTQGIKYPRKIENLIDRKIIVAGNSIQQQQLASTKPDYPELSWEVRNEKTTYEILEDVLLKKADIAIISTLDFQKYSPFFPGLKIAFELKKPQKTFWLMADKEDKSLHKTVNQFLWRAQTKKLIKNLTKKYYQSSNPLNTYDTLSFKKHFTERFPPLEQWFKQAAKETNINWLLLSSIAYQESHWNPKAVSSTGVKGIMMLTNAAAKEVKVQDRTDPKQSIFGGAQYLQNVKAKIPDRIKEPDRTFLALAGYNVGFGHLEDARILAKRAGANPDTWEDVKQYLPLLTKPKYYSTVKYGYARGYEPVNYVKNIRQYLKVLTWEIKQSAKIQDNKKRLLEQITNQDATTDEPSKPEDTSPEVSTPTAL